MANADGERKTRLKICPKMRRLKSILRQPQILVHRHIFEIPAATIQGPMWCIHSMFIDPFDQGGRCWGTVWPAFLERSGSFIQQRLFCSETKYCHHFHAFWKAFIELSTKVILLLESFQRKSSCFWRAFNESQPAFEGLSTKVSLFSLNRKKKTMFLSLRDSAVVA